MNWQVIFHREFEPEFAALLEGVQDELLAHALLLRDYGPGLGRPTVDTQGETPWQKNLKMF